MMSIGFSSISTALRRRYYLVEPICHLRKSCHHFLLTKSIGEDVAIKKLKMGLAQIWDWWEKENEKELQKTKESCCRVSSLSVISIDDHEDRRGVQTSFRNLHLFINNIEKLGVINVVGWKRNIRRQKHIVAGNGLLTKLNWFIMTNWRKLDKEEKRFRTHKGVWSELIEALLACICRTKI